MSVIRASSVFALLLVWLLAAAPAEARTAACFPGASGGACHFQTAKVTWVNDGDTVYADLDGDGSHRIYSIRFRSVQAMELHRYSPHRSKRRGECHAVAATNRVEDLVRDSHWRIRLSSQHPSKDHLGRLIRWVGVRVNGRWQDLGEILMREGHTLFMDNISDTAWNSRYDLAGQQAAQEHRNMWNPTTCGVGPQQQVPIKVWVLSDPLGWDTPAGEWVKIQNQSPSEALRLGGWWVRDAMLRRFTFPAGSTVAPGATVTLHVGAGTSGGGDFYWGLRSTVFENAGDARDLGDGAYLFDPQGDLRAWMLYPCRVACADPNQDTLDVTAQPRRPEHVTVHNHSDRPVALYGYALSILGAQVPFEAGTVLQPGETLTVYMQGSRDERHLGLDGYALPDAGGWAGVSTFSGIKLACDAWGSGSC